MINFKRVFNSSTDIFVRFFTSWCLSAIITYPSHLGSTYYLVSFAEQINIATFGFIFIFSFPILSYIAYFYKSDLYSALVVVLIYSCRILLDHKSESMYFACLIVVFTILYSLNQKKYFSTHLDVLNASNSKTKLIIFILAMLSFSYIAILTSMRYLSYVSPTYDFGIFAQMYESMIRDFSQITTVERDKVLSHFAVHVSPIYYLLLPIYFLFPTPITLLVSQALLLTSGVIPLYLLCKHYLLGNKTIIAICSLYLSFPALIGGTFYDFHENKFLTPLILWFLYFMEKKKISLMYVFAFLVMFVKEDAPVYVAFIALYMFFSKKLRKHSIFLFISSIVYFSGVISFLEVDGNGAMFSRYYNISGVDGSLYGVIKTAIVNPAKILYEVFSEGKFEFLLYYLAPIAFIPLFSNKIARFTLILPMVLVNLMTSYKYQFTIDFQYTYGSTALLFYLSVLNLKDFDTLNYKKLKNILLCMGICATLILSVSRVPSQTSALRRYITDSEDIQLINETLELIPEGESVLASTMLTAHLSDHQELYLITSDHHGNYVAIDMRTFLSHDEERDIEYFEDLGYELIIEHEDVIALLKYKSTGVST